MDTDEVQTATVNKAESIDAGGKSATRTENEDDIFQEEPTVVRRFHRSMIGSKLRKIFKTKRKNAKKGEASGQNARHTKPGPSNETPQKDNEASPTAQSTVPTQAQVCIKMKHPHVTIIRVAKATPEVIEISDNEFEEEGTLSDCVLIESDEDGVIEI